MMIHFRLEELTRSTCMQQTPHIFKPNDNIVPKIYTLFLYFLGSVRTRRTIYLTVVRAHLAYSSQVWAPQTVELIKEIERIQRRATKYILQLPYRFPDTYKERLI